MQRIIGFYVPAGAHSLVDAVAQQRNITKTGPSTYWVSAESEDCDALFQVFAKHNLWKLSFYPASLSEVPLWKYTTRYTYSEEEVQQADFFQVTLLNAGSIICKEPKQPYPGWELGKYPIQAFPLAITFPKRKTPYPHFFEIGTKELLCSGQFRQQAEEQRLTGVEFLPVFQDTKFKKPIEGYFQTKITHVLPASMQSGFYFSQSEYDNPPTPPRMHYPRISTEPYIYRQHDKENFLDFNQTQELWGLDYWPLYIISKRVYVLMQDLGIKYNLLSPIFFK